jgi:xanthine dehydrogenase YagT iron-sulfur-binding subunit
MDTEEEQPPPAAGFSRREFVGLSALGAAAAGRLTAGLLYPEDQVLAVESTACALSVNGVRFALQIDSRTTLLDLLRERLQLAGTKKGCDHGQCGACTVLVNGKRINSCLSLAVMNDGNEVTTIEGIAGKNGLHPVQAAFIEHDGLQCGYCTPGQICSAVAMLDEVKQGWPSAVTANGALDLGATVLTDDEIRERMSGNICRCGAYVGIVAAIRAVHQGRTA